MGDSISGLLYIISLKAHTSIKTEDLTTRNKRIRLYLRNASIGSSSKINVQLKFIEGETWQSFSFNFDEMTIPTDIAAAGGFDQMYIELASADDTGLTTTYYIDTISGSSEQTKPIQEEPKAAFLSEVIVAKPSESVLVDNISCC